MKTLFNYYMACDDLALDCPKGINVPITGLTNNSKKVKPGDLFIAIQGAKSDGRQYIPAAIAAGAAAVLYKGETTLDLSVPSIRVSDDYRAEGRCAECFYDFPMNQLKLVGVTGTNGKTTTAFLVRDILRAHGLKVGMIGTVQYELGDRVIQGERTTPTPLELQAYFAEMVRSGVEAAVMEVSSHALHQGRIGGAKFDVAIFSNLTQDHLDYHQTMEDYYQAKKLLFTQHLWPDSVAVINADDGYGQRLRRELDALREAGTWRGRLLSYGHADGAELHAPQAKMSIAGADLVVTLGHEMLQIKSTLVGDYNVSNVLAAFGATVFLGVPSRAASQAITDFAGVPGRLQRVSAPNEINLFVDYAHTPDALEKVLKTMRPLCQGRLRVVFGCGGDRDRTKRPIMGGIAAAIADEVIVTSDNPRTEEPESILDQIIAGIPADKPYLRQVDRRMAIKQVLATAQSHDTIILAGKGHEDYQEIMGQKHQFSDFEISRELVKTVPLSAAH